MECSKQAERKIHLTKQMLSLFIKSKNVKGPQENADALRSFILTAV
jgi:hypothetical protein